MKNVLLLTDVGNIYHSLKKRHPNRRLNYEKYMELATEGKDLYKAVAYCSETDGKTENFFNKLQSLGYEVKSKQPHIFQVQHPSGDPRTIKRLSWISRITIDAVIYSGRIDEIVIGSNNDELVDLVKFIKDRGVYVTIYASNIGKQLATTADNYLEIPEGILYAAPSNESPDEAGKPEATE